MNNAHWTRFLLVAGALLLLAVYGWQTRPFLALQARQTVSLLALSPAQRENIQLAAANLDRLVLRPGEVFSFNRVVGPRTVGRGYRAAPSYLEGESPQTLGGGVCLLSSTLYQLVLRSGLAVNERVPHLRTIRSVPPGLDATVWYGQADLKFQNTLPFPVQLRVQTNPTGLQLSLWGRETAVPLKLKRVLRAFPQGLQVEVYRENSQHRFVRLSRDLYRFSS